MKKILGLFLMLVSLNCYSDDIKYNWTVDYYDTDISSASLNSYKFGRNYNSLICKKIDKKFICFDTDVVEIYSDNKPNDIGYYQLIRLIKEHHNNCFNENFVNNCSAKSFKDYLETGFE